MVFEESESSQFSFFRLRDIVVLALIAAAVLHCYLQPTSYEYALEPVWFVETYDTDSIPSETTKGSLLSPLVMDIDRDNVKDLISIGYDNIMRISRIGSDFQSMSHVIHAEEFLRKKLFAMMDPIAARAIGLGGGCCFSRTTPILPTTTSADESEAVHSWENFIVVLNSALRMEAQDSSLLTLWEKEFLSLEDFKSFGFSSLPTEGEELNLFLKQVLRCEYRGKIRVLPRFPFMYTASGVEEDVTAVVVAVEAGTDDCPIAFQIKAFEAQSGLEIWSHRELRSVNTPEKVSDNGSRDGLKGRHSSDFSHLRFANHPYYDRVLSYYERIQEMLASRRKVSESSSVPSTGFAKYRASLAHQFPHFWRSNDDDKLQLAYFESGKVSTRRRNDSPRLEIAHKTKGLLINKNKGSSEHSSVSASGRSETRRKKSQKSLLKLGSAPVSLKKSSNATIGTVGTDLPRGTPNTAVFHSRKGIKAITVLTGEVLLDLSLEEGVYYGDINHDGNLDSLYFRDLFQVNYEFDHLTGLQKLSVRRQERDSNGSSAESLEPSSSRERKDDSYSFAVLSGYPVHSWLFNDSQLCLGRDDSLDGPRKSAAGKRRSWAQRKAGGRLVSTPLFLRSHLSRGVVGSWKESRDGDSDSAAPLKRASATSDSLKARHRSPALVIGNNFGVLGAYNRYGRLLWQQDDGGATSTASVKSAIAPILMEMSPLSAAAVDAERAFESRLPEDLLLTDNLLFIHDKKVRIHSLADHAKGRLLVETSLPQPTSHSPLILDFNDDGINDLVLITESAILGYRVHISPSFFPMVIPFLILLAIMVLIFALKASSESTSVTAKSSIAGQRSDKKTKKWTLTRATDSQHLD